MGTQARCLILFLDEDQMGVIVGERERKRAVPIPAGDKRTEEAYPMWVCMHTLEWGGQANQHMVIKSKDVNNQEDSEMKKQMKERHTVEG